MTQAAPPSATAALRAQAAITADGIDAFGAWARGNRASRQAVQKAEQAAISYRRELQRAIGNRAPGPIPPKELLAISADLARLLGRVSGLVRETEALAIEPTELDVEEMVKNAYHGVRQLRRAFEALDRGSTDARTAQVHSSPDTPVRTRSEQDTVPTNAVTTAAEPVDTVPRLAHIRSLDGLRGMAVLVVVLFHFSPSVLPGGFLGVDLFFVLSGFLITSLLVTEWDATSRIALGAFWARRARRLLPAMLLVLASVGIYALMYTDAVGGRAVAEDGLASFLYVANWHFIDVGQNYIRQAVNQDLSPLRHMWSLAIEEQFYLVWPLTVAGIGLLVAKTGGRNRHWSLRNAVGGVSVVVGVASVVRMITLYDPSHPDRVYYGTDTRAHLLLFGAAIGAFTAGAPIVTSASARRLLVRLGSILAVGLLAVMTFTTTADSWLYRGGYAVIGLAMILVLVAAAQPGRHLLRRVLETRGLVALGLISYGVYLWHWPVFILLTESRTGLDGLILFFVRTATTLVIALASYYLVEIPIRKQRWLARPARAPGLRPMPVTLVSTVAALLLVPALALPAFVNAPPPTKGVQATVVTATYRDAPRCDTAGKDRTKDLRGVRVMLIGNSIANEIAGCLDTVLRRHGASVVSIARNGLVTCEYPGLASQELEKPASTRPNTAILFTYPLYSGCANERNEHAQMKQLLALLEKSGVTRTYLAPFVPPPPGDTAAPAADPNGIDQRHVGIDWAARSTRIEEFFRSLAEKQPSRLNLIDAGQFLRDDAGKYQLRMPCVADREPGCDSKGMLVVRWPGDGIHFCADPAWIGGECGPTNEGGVRRVAAAIVKQLLESPPATARSST